MTRWIVAFPVAGFAYALGLALIGAVWKSVGVDASAAVMMAATLGTAAAAYAGILVAPPQNRKVATYVFVGVFVSLAALFLLANLIKHTSMVVNLNFTAGSVLGGLVVLWTRPIIELGRKDKPSSNDRGRRA